MDLLSKPTTPKRSTAGSLAKLMHNVGGSPQKASRILYEDSKVTLVKYDRKEPMAPQQRTDSRAHDVKEIVISEHLSELHEDKALCDLTLTVGGAKLDIHKVVLSRCSDKYLNIFTGPDADKQSNEIVLPNDVSLDAAKEVVRFMYKGRIHLNEENVTDVLIISTELGIQKLIERCADILKQCSEEKIMPHLELANRLQLNSLKQHMVEKAAKHFDAVSQTVDLLKLSLEDFLAILRSRTSHGSSEAVAYAAILNWLKAVPERTQSAFEILKDVQFDKIDPRHIQLIDTNPDVVQLPEIKKLLCDAYKHHTLTLCNVLEKRGEQWGKLIKRASSMASQFRMPSLVSTGGHLSPENTLYGHLKGVFCKLDVGARTKRWDLLTNMPELRSFHCAVFVAGQIFVLGGCDTVGEGVTFEPTNTVFCFCVAQGVWNEMAPMTEKRMLFVAVNFSGLIYVIGGIGEKNKALSSVECYDPKKNVWSKFPSLPLNCVGACACIHADTIFVVGGYFPTFNRILPMSTVFYFKFDAYRWESKTPMPSKRFFAAAVAVNDVPYVIGGANTGEKAGELTSHSEIYEYNDDSQGWSIVGTLKTPRHSFGIAVIGNVIYVVGGQNYSQLSPVSTLETFNVETLQSEEVSACNLLYDLLGSAFCLVDSK